MYGKVLPLLMIIILVIASGCTTATSSDQSPAQLTTGSLEVTSSPQGAEIYFDGVYRGTTPSTITDAPQGSHLLELRYHGYNSWSKHVEVQGGTKYHVDATLPPIVVSTSIPTTTVPTTVPTTTQKTVVGCWKQSITQGDEYVEWIMQLEPDGVGMLYGNGLSPTRSMATSSRLTWFQAPGSTVIRIDAEASEGYGAASLSFNYDASTDTLINPKSPSYPYYRVTC